MAEPPSEAGVFQATVTSALPQVPFTEVGALGTLLSVTAELGAEDADVPTALVAVTLMVYVEPFVSPVIGHAVAGAGTVQEIPPGVAVAV